MTAWLALDNNTARDLRFLQPHMNMISMSEPRKLSSAAVFPKPVAATINNWLYDEKPVEITQQDRAYMDTLRA